MGAEVVVLDGADGKAESYQGNGYNPRPNVGCPFPNRARHTFAKGISSKGKDIAREIGEKEKPDYDAYYRSEGVRKYYEKSIDSSSNMHY